MKIAVVDSGVHPEHPHIGGIAGGVSFVDGDLIDRIGHGTAVAAAILEKSRAEIYAVKIFDRRLSTRREVLLRALGWCSENDMDVVNLSVGLVERTPWSAAGPQAGLFERRGERDQGVARGPGGPPHVIVTVPGVVTGAIEVQPDDSCPRDRFFYRDAIFYASPYPRPIPGVPLERNLQGASFAVANMTGFVAQILATTSREAIRSALIARAANNP